MSAPGKLPAVRSTRTTAIEALEAGCPTVNGRVYTPPVPERAPMPYLLVSNYSESPDNFFGRAGSRVGFDVTGQVRSESGDAPMLALYEDAAVALNRVSLEIDGHMHLEGTLRLLVTYTDPKDGKILRFVARYEGRTKNR